MATRFDRRAFLKGLVVTVAAAPLAACGDSGTDDGGGPSSDPADQDRVFPQGIASGDPSPDSVILWTRVEPESESGPFDVLYEISKTEDFAEILASGNVSAAADVDFTLRIRPTGLEPFMTYYYRFTSRDVISPTGRTKTAPTEDQDVNVRFAFAACQDFIGRYYHSWKALTDDPTGVDFVLFLGDYVYETNGDPDFQQVSEDRAIEIPEGVQLEPEDNPAVKGALTLADYRGLYKQYRRDENLRRAHALYPFIAVWDDHEFANDCWQDHSTDFNDAMGDEKNPDRRHAASQAWFEFQPANVDFLAAEVPPADLTIYRTLRYGKHMELVLTDQRSYRSDHVVPEGADPNTKPAGAPASVPNYSATGKTALLPNSEVFSRSFVQKAGYDLLEAYVSPTMLGATQKAWFIDKITSSTATWKFWGNQTQLVEMMLDLTSFDIPAQFKAVYYFTVDQWDGFRTERKEILDAIAGTSNVVALTGDIHGFYAAEIHSDPAVVTDEPILVEYVTAGISSSPTQEITQTVVDSSSAFSSLAPLVPQFDAILTSTSPEYKHSDSLIHGIAIVDVQGTTEIRVAFLGVADVKSKDWDGTVTQKTFRTVAGSNRIEEV